MTCGATRLRKMSHPPCEESRRERPADVKVSLEKGPDHSVIDIPPIEYSVLAANVELEIGRSILQRIQWRIASSLVEWLGYYSTEKIEPDDHLPPYAKLLKQLKSSRHWHNDIAQGKRIGLYKLRGQLGSGNFAQVRAATHCLTKEKVAIKIIDKSKLDAKTRRMLYREISTMENLHHPNAIRLYEVVETLSKVYLVMEFAGGGELFKRISQRGAFTEPHAKIIFSQICSAVDHMHQQKIIHRDLKAENVFIIGNLYVKVGDYGFSTTICYQDDKLTTFCGSPPYAAPELFREEKYAGPYVDIWALGILLYFIVSALMPFTAPTVSMLRRLILDGQYQMPPGISDECRDLIKNILQMTPRDRLSLEQIQSHDFLADIPRPIPFNKYNLCPQIEEDRPAADHGSSQRVDTAETTSESDSVKTILIPQSKEETEVQRQLNALGITDEMMAECQYIGAKSMVTGTYRILLHRIQMAEHGEAVYGAMSEGSPSRSSSPASNAPKDESAKRTLVWPNDEQDNNFTYTQNSVKRSGPSPTDRLLQVDLRRPGLTVSKACVIL